MRKFPTLPLNSNGVWIDPTGGVWRKASGVKEHTGGDYGVNGGVGGGGGQSNGGGHQMQPDYERLVVYGCCGVKRYLFYLAKWLIRDIAEYLLKKSNSAALIKTIYMENFMLHI